MTDNNSTSKDIEIHTPRVKVDEFIKIPFVDLLIRFVTISVISIVSILLVGQKRLPQFSEEQIHGLGALGLVIFSATLVLAVFFLILRDYATHPSESTLDAKNRHGFWLYYLPIILKKLATDLTFWNFNVFVGLSMVAVFAENTSPLVFTVPGFIAAGFVNYWVRREKGLLNRTPKVLMIILYMGLLSLALYGAYYIADNILFRA